MAISLVSNSGQFSVLTIGGPSETEPAWTRQLRWPDRGDDHIALDPSHAAHRNVWAAQLDAAVLRADRTVLLVAEGVGCLATSWWARLSPSHYVSRIAGALMFEPEEGDAEQRRLYAAPRTALPFPSMVVANRPAELTREVELNGLVDSWGSRFLVGQRQREGEARAWRNAQRLVRRLTAAVVRHDVERGMALRGEQA